MPEVQKTVFISYRRKPAAYIARAIFENLRAHGYDVFMDVENIGAGEFGTIIDNQIKARAHFLIILTTGTVARFDEEKDWLRHEIEYAMKQKRNIVPLLIDGFKFNRTTKRYLTGDLAALPSLNGLRVPHDYFEDAMEKLRTRFLKAPEYVKTEPTPPTEQAEVKRKVEETAAQPPPTKAELSAEDYFNRAFARDEQDYDGKIADYSEAIQLNPQYIEAYGNRGSARDDKGDHDGAIADYNEVLRLNPQEDKAYSNRGIVRYRKGDSDGAITDFNEAIRLNPRNAQAYNGRGAVREHKGDFDGAIADYEEAIRLNPQYAFAYNNRGITQYHKGVYDSAIVDFNERIHLDPDTNAAEIYGNRGEAYFAVGDFKKALEDFLQADRMRSNHDLTRAGLAITYHALGQSEEAKDRWRALIEKDERYQDADWVGKQFGWAAPLIEAARKLISEL